MAATLTPPVEGPVIGVDVGGTKVAVGEVTEAGVRGRVEHPTDLSSSEAMLAGIEVAVGEVVSRTGPPAAIGVGVPSQIEFASGTVLASVNIPLQGVALREELSRRLGVPVVVDNDANCAALAEAAWAPSGPVENLVMLTLGTGVGGGVVSGGRIFRGASGLGAELGHLVIDENGPVCPGRCPSRGCLEAYCSGTALGREATAVGRDWPETPLGQAVAEGGSADGRDVVEAARAGDHHALRLLEQLGTRLGVGIAGIANVFEPERVVIGGGLSGAGDLFLDAARREAGYRALRVISERVSISLARAGPDAGVIGAGILAAQELERGDTPRRQASEGGA